MDGYFEKRLRLKKCKCCLKIYAPYSTFSKCCSVKCSLEYNKIEKEKQEEKNWQIRKKAMKEELKSYSSWLKDLEQEINSIVRLIDYDCRCISCYGNGKPQAGHYHSVNANGNIRFNLHNIHIQDYRCNVKLSGNINGYDHGLISLFGEEYWRFVKFELRKLTPSLKLSVPEIKNSILIAQEIKKELSIKTAKKTIEDRIKLREELNKRIGIYKMGYNETQVGTFENG